MEFVQYHPTGLPGTGILMTAASRGEGGYLINNKGDRYLSEYLPGKMELGPRDMVSRAFVHEEKAGRVFDGPYGTYVHLDLRHLGEKKIDERVPFVRELTKNYVGIDPVYAPVPVRPSGAPLRRRLPWPNPINTCRRGAGSAVGMGASTPSSRAAPGIAFQHNATGPRSGRLDATAAR